jgi:secondary thiamine-phosphate synthase enzyme
MSWFQKEVRLAPRSRGFHLVTSEIVDQVPELRSVRIGFAHVFILHTSASLTINENADPTVRADMESHFNALAPEDAPYYAHTDEGPDDMPAHIKTALVGCGLLIPITDGRLNLGTWQGIYLGEHRDHAKARRLVITVTGATDE